MDVGADAHWGAVPRDCAAQPVPCFGALTAALYALAAWLRQCQIATMVMASTGVYGIALCEVREERGFDVKLVDPHAVRHVPGRKTDVKDGQGLQELHTYGLLRGAVRPEDEGCVLRSSLAATAYACGNGLAYGAPHVESPRADAPQADRGSQ